MNPYMHRDISWLSFNERVLQEAANRANPLFERFKFMAIYSNNLDEFFRVRVANHRNLLRLGKKTKAQLEYDPKELIKQIKQIVNDQQEEFSRIFEEELLPELETHRVKMVRHTQLDADQNTFIDQYFNNHMLPYVQPVLLVKDKIRPFLNNAALYLIVVLRDKARGSQSRDYAIVKIPSDHLPRFIELPEAGGDRFVIMLDELVRHSIPWLFPGYEIIDSFSMKLTRDAELYIDDEFSGDLIEKIRRSLTNRNIGPASRLVYDRDMDVHTLHFLKEMFDLDTIDLFAEGRYHNNMDFFHFPDFGLAHLRLVALPPLPFEPLEGARDFYARVRWRDYLIHPPYHSYESVIQFFERAASDADVTHIKLVQYRVGPQSRIMTALKEAVRNGKQVSVFIEVKARFDEEANLKWGEELEKHGVMVHYSFPGLKVHAKLAMVRRLEKDGPMLYTYLSTGNFHEGTARVYSDVGLFTADERITGEVAQVFSFLETVQIPEKPFEHLLVGQFNLVDTLQELIREEVHQARLGREAEICLKLNSLQDPHLIDELYSASQAGVRIRVIVRGICSLVPGIPGLSEGIEVISIVDRFLEHARYFIFRNQGDPRIYISSADWMVRNLYYRIETACPIYHPAIREVILDLFEIQWQDTVKARLMDAGQTNAMRIPEKAIALRSQHETYYYFKRRLDSATTKT